MFELSVIIPCYNEAGRLPPFFSLIREHAELPWEWVFVDDGSRDDTRAVIEAFRADTDASVHLIGLDQNCGKGAAVRAGMLAARGKLVGFVDADLAASPLQFDQFKDTPGVVDGSELLLGIRVKTHDGRVKRLLYRHLMGRCFQTYTSMMTGLTVYDTQCGFKLMAADRARAIAERMRCDGFAFDVEMILVATQMGMVVREEMINWQEMGDSRIRPQHILQMAIDIWRIRRRHRRA
jgi:dolichyl-phosphate beta-glucosyltransferase